jgi:hypothetical protein
MRDQSLPPNTMLTIQWAGRHVKQVACKHTGPDVRPATPVGRRPLLGRRPKLPAAVGCACTTPPRCDGMEPLVLPNSHLPSPIFLHLRPHSHHCVVPLFPLRPDGDVRLYWCAGWAWTMWKCAALCMLTCAELGGPAVAFQATFLLSPRRAAYSCVTPVRTWCLHHRKSSGCPR